MKYAQASAHITHGTCEKFLNPPTFKFAVSSSGRTFQKYEEDLASGYQEEFESGLLTVDDEIRNTPLMVTKRNGNALKELHVAETILTGATINNCEFAPRRWANHGLVYADYYFMLFGNMLLDLGLVDLKL